MIRDICSTQFYKDEIKEMIKIAENTYENGQYLKAVDRYDKTIFLDPDLNASYFYKGQAYNEYSRTLTIKNEEDFNESIDYYNKSIEQLEIAESIGDTFNRIATIIVRINILALAIENEEYYNADIYEMIEVLERDLIAFEASIMNKDSGEFKDYEEQLERFEEQKAKYFNSANKEED